MNKSTIILLLIVLAEIPFFGKTIYNKVTMPKPPIPRMANTDQLTRDSLLDLAQGVKSVDDWVDLGEKYLARGFFAESAACYKQAAVLAPESAEIAFHRGFCLSRGGKIKEGNEEFQRSIDLKYSSALSAAYFMGRNHLRNEDPESAKKAFAKCSKLSIARLELGKIHFRQGDLEQAKELLLGVIDDQRNSMRAYPLLSRIFAAEGERRKAVSFSVEGSENTDRLPSPFGTERKRLLKAFETVGYEKALRDALILGSVKKMETASVKFKELQEIEWTRSTNEQLIEIERRLVNRKEALALMKERVERLGPVSQYLDALADYCRTLHLNEESLEYYQLGAQAANDLSKIDCFVALAKEYEKTGDKELSIKYQIQSIHSIVIKHLSEGDFKRSVNLVNECLALDEKVAKTHYLHGKALRLQLDLEGAKAAYEKCLELDPTFGKAIRELEILGL